MTLETTTYGADSQRLMAQAGDENSPYRINYAWSGSVVIAEYSEGYTSTTTPQYTKSYVDLGARLLLQRFACG